MIHSSKVATKRRTSGPAPLEIEHDVSDALAGPVIRELASTAAFVDREAGLDHVAGVCAGAGSVERRVLQEPNELGRPPGGDLAAPAPPSLRPPLRRKPENC